MDWTSYFSASVAGIPLFLVVMGLVTLARTKFGLSGNVLTGVSFGVGLVLGVLYQMSVQIPASFGGWFAVIVYGLALGLVASGVFDTAKVLLGSGKAGG